MKRKNGEKYGMLRLCLSTRADHNYYSDCFYIYDEMLRGDIFLVNSMISCVYDKHVKPINAYAINEKCNEIRIVSSYGNATLSINGNNTYETKEIGLDYATCKMIITLLPDDEEERENRKQIIEKVNKLVYEGWELLNEGLNDGADECASEVIDLLSPISDSGPINYRITLSDAYYLRGRINSKKGDEEEIEETIKLYKESESLRDRLLRQTKDKEVLRKYAQIKNTLGLLYLDKIDYKTAVNYLEKAASMYEWVDSIAPGEYREVYAESLAMLANVQRMAGWNDLALKTSQEGLKVCQLPHDEIEEEEYLVDAIMCQEIISLIYSDEEKYQEAIIQGEKVIELLHLLCHKNNINIYVDILNKKEEWLKGQQMFLANDESDDHDMMDDDGRFDAWS